MGHKWILGLIFVLVTFHKSNAKAETDCLRTLNPGALSEKPYSYAPNNYSIDQQVSYTQTAYGRLFLRSTADIPNTFINKYKEMPIAESSFLSLIGFQLNVAEGLISLPDQDYINHTLMELGSPLRVKAYSSNGDIDNKTYWDHLSRNILLIGTNDVFYVHDVTDHTPGYFILSQTEEWSAFQLAAQKLDRLLSTEGDLNPELKSQAQEIIKDFAAFLEVVSFNVARSNTFGETDFQNREIERFKTKLKAFIIESNALFSAEPQIADLGSKFVGPSLTSLPVL